MVDVVGNVWQWTASEFVDAHTRSIILRGGSSYVPLTDPYTPPCAEPRVSNAQTQRNAQTQPRAAQFGPWHSSDLGSTDRAAMARAFDEIRWDIPFYSSTWTFHSTLPRTVTRTPSPRGRAPPMKFSWYFQPALQLDRHNRWLAQKGNLAYSRAATVGFRCLKDVPGGAPAPLHYRSAEPAPLRGTSRS